MIRQMRPEDAPECSELIRACMEQDPSIPPLLRTELLRREEPEAMLERARLFYVTVFQAGEHVAGVGGIELNEIRLLCVAPAHRKGGIGRSILQHLETMVPQALFREIFVYASPGASGFYQASGYEARGEHVFTIHGHDLKTIFMVKRL
jgi:N-acetylglutamate synthase-like GNAT family acetyltransferase